MKVRFGSHRGFTLVELLVVIAIIGVLVALLLPAVQQAREAARRMSCGNNLKQYGLGLHNYIDVHKQFPMGMVLFDQHWNGVGPMGWQARILPQMEQGPLFDQLNMDGGNAILNRQTGSMEFMSQWHTLVNTPKGWLRARQVQVPYATCPSDNSSNHQDWARASYSGSLGSQLTPSADGNCNIFYTQGVHYEEIQGTWGGNAGHGDAWVTENLSGIFSRHHGENENWTGHYGGVKCTLSDVRDGTSNVIAVGEVLADCHDHLEGWWSRNGMGTAHASTSVPINTLTTCVGTLNLAQKRNYPYPQCFTKSNWNFSWGFKSRHPSGAQFVFADGSVHFLGNSVNYNTYQRLGGKADGLSTGDY